MLQSFFRYLSSAAWAQKTITGWPAIRKMAGRFVAGETIPEALSAIRELNARGIFASLDHLGENTTSKEAAHQAADDILRMMPAIAQSGVQANISIKLSQLGLAIDPEYCRANLRAVLEKAGASGNFVRIDMEDSGLTDQTLDQYFWALEQGFNVGIVIQAYLYRSEKDIRRVLAAGGRIRLCKGAYREPAELAFPKKSDVDQNYDRLAQIILKDVKTAGLVFHADGFFPPVAAFATHDEKRISLVKQVAADLGIPKEGIEFQMLFGIRRELQERLVEEGYPVRVYVPYGSHWYPYFMRRLAERPANVWFFVSNFFRR